MSKARYRTLLFLVSIGPSGFWVYYSRFLRGPLGLDTWVWYPLALAGIIGLVALAQWALYPVTQAWVRERSQEHHAKALDAQLHEHVLDMLTMVNMNLPPNITVFPDHMDVTDQRGEDQ